MSNARPASTKRFVVLKSAALGAEIPEKKGGIQSKAQALPSIAIWRSPSLTEHSGSRARRDLVASHGPVPNERAKPRARRGQFRLSISLRGQKIDNL
jgi:hypothetical protein